MRSLKFLFVFIVFAIASSCNTEELYVGQTSISVKNGANAQTDVPFADEQTLAEMDLEPDYVPYKTARKLAVLEMELELRESMNWNGAHLSEKPVIIFDGQSKPKYYEFIVTDESGRALGTVTACARKEADAAISHVLPFVRDYSSLATKGGDYKMISNGYPSRILLGIPGKSGDEPSAVIDPETGEAVTDIISEDAQAMIDALTALTEEEKENLGITSVDSMIMEVEQKDALNREYAEEYWGQIDSLQAELDSMSDEEIAAAVNESKGYWTNIWTTIDTCFIAAYNTPNMRNTRWEGWCGPSALAWIYRGLYSSFKGTNILLAGDAGFRNRPVRDLVGSKGFYDFNDGGDTDGDGRRNDLDKDWVNPLSNANDGGLYARLADQGGMYVWSSLTSDQNGPTLSFSLATALASATDGKYTVKASHFSLTSLEPLDHMHIRTYKLPLICWVDGLSHYVVAFGSKYQYLNWETIVKIFRKKITVDKRKARINKWLYVYDNGYTTDDHGYDPYWKNDKLSFGFQFGVIRKY